MARYKSNSKMPAYKSRRPLHGQRQRPAFAIESASARHARAGKRGEGKVKGKGKDPTLCKWRNPSVAPATAGRLRAGGRGPVGPSGTQKTRTRKVNGKGRAQRAVPLRDEKQMQAARLQIEAAATGANANAPATATAKKKSPPFANGAKDGAPGATFKS